MHRPIAPRLGGLVVAFILILLKATTASHDEPSCTQGVTASSSVSTTNEAAKLSRDLLLCHGGEFIVHWEGSVAIDQPLRVTEGTSLHITGSSDGAMIHGVGEVQIFEVNGTGSSLHLEKVALNGGLAELGGAISARGASITLRECELHDNEATVAGGEDKIRCPGVPLCRVPPQTPRYQTLISSKGRDLQLRTGCQALCDVRG